MTPRPGIHKQLQRFTYAPPPFPEKEFYLVTRLPHNRHFCVSVYTFIIAASIVGNYVGNVSDLWCDQEVLVTGP